MPEQEKSPEDVTRDKFRHLTIHGQRQIVFDSSEDDTEPLEVKPWEAQLAACAKSQACRDGLIPELQDRIRVMDEMMELVSDSLADVNKVIGARNGLQSLIERLRQFGE